MNSGSNGPVEVRVAMQQYVEGNMLRVGGDLEGAISHYRQAVQADAQFVDALYNLGRALKEKGELNESAEVFEKALAVSPGDAEIWYMLGNVRRELDHLVAARTAYLTAIRCRPDLLSARNNLGIVLQAQGEVQSAIDCFLTILREYPENADAHHNLALACLSEGDYHRGWQEYEWRLHTSDGMNPARVFPHRWNGEALAGKSILLSAEQGLGDAIQFIRFASVLKEKGAIVVVECRPELMRLFASARGVDNIVAYGQLPPLTDFQIPLLSVPAVLGTTTASLSSQVPYLAVDQHIAEYWKAKFPSDPSSLKVGLVWAGNPSHRNDRKRSMPAGVLEALLKTTSCTFYALQKEEAHCFDSELLVQLPNPLGGASDFADTAAVIQNLDLVITVDTALAHLAGGLGLPVWTLLPHFPDWRWMRGRSDSPWYPTMRLFRQESPGDWQTVIQRVASELRGMVRRTRESNPIGPCAEEGVQTQSADVNTLFDEARHQQQVGKHVEAEEAYREILLRSPNHTGARNNLAVLLQGEGRLNEAIEQGWEALKCSPGDVAVLNNLGYALHEAKNYTDAERCLRRAIAQDDSLPEVWNNLGNTLKELTHYEEALNCYRRAIAQRPEYVEAHWNLAQICLLTGRMEEGWKEYEWRWKKRDFTSPHRSFPQPQWDGSRLDGKSILLHAEQGFGDAIQFVRYVPLVRECGGRIILECHRELAPLFRSLSGVEELKVFGDPLPPFHVHAPLMSLPRCMQTTVESIPAHTPYLAVEGTKDRIWSERITRADARLRVGIVWSGNRHITSLGERSCPPDAFGLLSDLDGVEWYSLQKEVPDAERRVIQQHLPVIDLGEYLKDFSDTAAAIARLDLVITIDTATAHLAGALGRPVWVLLAQAHDWRWMIDREDSPWYPTMRLFRQKRAGDWGSVLASVRSALLHRIAASVSTRVEPPEEDPALVNDRALALHSDGKFLEARDMFRKVLAQHRNEAAVYYNLGNTLRELHDNEGAEQAYRESLALGLERPEVYNNLGATLNSVGRWDEAKAVLARALALDSTFVMAHANLGYALLQQNRVEEAIPVLEAAIRIRPEYADAHWLLSHANLILGQWSEGWKQYEWRWAKLDQTLYPYLHRPRWRGEPLMGKRILVFTEQGLGDGIQFIRYIRDLADRGAEVILECQPELVSLFRSVKGIHQIISRGTSVPEFDLQCPLMSLPQYLQSRNCDVPGEVPYLTVDSERSKVWFQRMGGEEGILRVGVVWSGSAEHRNDVQRSIPAHLFGKIGSFAAVRFFSLQKGRGRPGSDSLLLPGMQCIDLAGYLDDFGETAAAIQNLDLVISVDTAVAHCAGALGKPVWVLLPYAPDWRWMLDREESIWYPTMRLIRQRRPGEWEEVLDRVREDLLCLLGGHNNGHPTKKMEIRSSPYEYCR